MKRTLIIVLAVLSLCMRFPQEAPLPLPVPVVLDELVWLGLSSDWNDPLNWVRNTLGGGIPGSTDSIVIGPLGLFAPKVSKPAFSSVGALTILGGASVEIDSTGSLIIEGALNIGSGGVLMLSADASQLTVKGDIINNGSIVVSSGKSSVIECGGDWKRGVTASFVRGQSTVLFRNPDRKIQIDGGSFYNIIIDSSLMTVATANISVSQSMVLLQDLHLGAKDTLSVLNGNAGALAGEGKIRRGTIRRVIDSTSARSGGAFRFDNPETNLRFFDEGNTPGLVTMTVYPDSFPPNTDPFMTVKRFYDIHQTGGVNFRARLTIAFDSAEGRNLPIDSMLLVRSTNDGLSWTTARGMSASVNKYTLASDSITGFSKWAISRPNTLDNGPGSDPTPPVDFDLRQNYPNPFNPTTRISYDLASKAEVRMNVYDLLGRKIATLAEGEQAPGKHEAVWDATGMQSGVYYCRIIVGKQSRTIRLLYVK